MRVAVPRHLVSETLRFAVGTTTDNGAQLAWTPVMDSLAAGPGGAHDPSMEMRLQRLEETFPRIEALMRSIDDRLRRVETAVDRVRNVQIELAELKGRVANLPSTWAMVTTILGGQVAFAAVLVAILRLAVPH